MLDTLDNVDEKELLDEQLDDMESSLLTNSGLISPFMGLFLRLIFFKCKINF